LHVLVIISLIVVSDDGVLLIRFLYLLGAPSPK